MMPLLLLLLALLLAGCSTPPPPLVLAAQADEFDSAPPTARKYRATMTREDRLAFGLNAPIPVLAAQIHQESNWNEQARSGVGAQGLAQFMPATARDFPDERGEVQPYNPDWALRAQARYMKRLWDAVRYADDCNRVGGALASYNGGLGWHNKRQALAATPGDYWNAVRPINPGINAANQTENAAYAPRIVRQLQPIYRTWGVTLCL